MSRPKTSREWHPHLSSYVSEPTNLNPKIYQYFNHNEKNIMRKTQKHINITNKQASKVYQLLSPKSGSHHTKNIYPQISKSKSIHETKISKSDGPCTDFKTSRHEGESPVRARNSSSP